MSDDQLGIKAFVIDSKNNVKSVPLSGWIPSERTGLPVEGAVSVRMIYQAVAAVYRCISVRAQAVSRVPFEITPKGTGTARIKATPDILTARIQKHAYNIEASLCQYGAAYLMHQRNRVKFLDLKWLRAESIEPTYDDMAGVVSFKRTLSDGKTRDLTPAGVEGQPPGDVVYIWLPDPDVELGPGTPPGLVALKAASAILRGDEHVTLFYERGGINVTLLITDPTTPDTELRRLEVWWKRLTRGVKKAWETVAMRKNVEIKQFGYPLKDLAMPELYAQSVRQIANAFGVPEYYLSSDVANFATARSYDLMFYDTVIRAEAAIIANALNEQLLNPLGYEMTYQFEKLELFQEAELQKAQAISALVGKPILLIDEGRALLEKEPIAPSADEKARASLTAQLSIVQAATDAGLSPQDGVRLALGEPLDTLLDEMEDDEDAADTAPVPPATPSHPARRARTNADG